MAAPINRFKARLLAGESLLGLWLAMPGAVPAEIAAGAGFDWLVIDTEHAPQDPLTITDGLRAAALHEVGAIVRPAVNDVVLIKRILDQGAQTLLIPMVNSADEARAAVAATRYPPQGLRGVAGVTRASDYGRVSDYLRSANDQIGVLVQIETLQAVAHIEAIAAVPGVDGLFIGPADLAANMGYLGQMDHPEVRAVLRQSLQRIRQAGVAAGILSLDEPTAREFMTEGSQFTAVGIDTAVLARQLAALVGRFRA